MSKSCIGCKYLYGDGSGYSNWTWLETWVRCALDRNPNLKDRDLEEPSDWEGHRNENADPDADNWDATKDSRCDAYGDGPYVVLDPDREDDAADFTDDEDAIIAIRDHGGGREAKPRWT